MEIRDLNRNGNSLRIFADDQGDVYVTISHDSEIRSIGPVKLSSTVRIGGCGSGHDVPPKIRSLLLQVAEEFEKYKDCKYENDAFDKDVKEFAKEWPKLSQEVIEQARELESNYMRKGL